MTLTVVTVNVCVAVALPSEAVTVTVTVPATFKEGFTVKVQLGAVPDLTKSALAIIAVLLDVAVILVEQFIVLSMSVNVYD